MSLPSKASASSTGPSGSRARSAPRRSADMGADVIKIEQTGGGATRAGVWSPPRRRMKRANWYFESHNRNKRGITLDFGKPEVPRCSTRSPRSPTSS